MTGHKPIYTRGIIVNWTAEKKIVYKWIVLIPMFLYHWIDLC